MSRPTPPSMLPLRRLLALGSVALLPFALFACRATQSTTHSMEEASVASRPKVTAPMPTAPETVYASASELELPVGDPENHQGLHNVYELSENVISGSEPYGEDAFRILADKGVRTILSVDGKVPDVELAEKYGMKYVHVPIQYRGITDKEVARITKTFREQEGPFFVHCFHGKHRGPAAAGIGRLVLDGVPREQAIAEMRQWCGTSPSYEGLYATVAYTDLPSEQETRAMDWDFPSAKPLEGVAGAMVPIARASDHLKAASKNGWQVDPSHPDLNALNEATQLASLLERSMQLEETQQQADDFRGWMSDAAERAAALRDILNGVADGESTYAEADAMLAELNQSCSACHEVFRN